MQLAELKQQLMNKTINPLYIFTGPEIAIMNVYIDKIATLANTDVKRVDSVVSISNKVQNRALTPKLSTYIVRNDKDYTTQENVWNKLVNGTLQHDNIIILVYDNLDKRSKFYKQHQQMIVEFEKLSSIVLAKYIEKEIGLGGEMAVQFAELCDNDYSRILLECDKLTQLSKVYNINIQEAYKRAIKEKLIYTSPKDVIFEFIDAVCKRQLYTSYKLLEELKGVDESPLVMLSLLYNNFRMMLLVQSSGDTNDICGRTGLTQWQVKVTKEKGQKYSIPELVRAIRVVRETERNIKIGQIDSEVAVDYVLVNVL